MKHIIKSKYKMNEIYMSIHHATKYRVISVHNIDKHITIQTLKPVSNIGWKPCYTLTFAEADENIELVK